MDFWSQEQIEFLKQHHIDMTYKEIGEHLNKTVAAVRNKCWRLSLRKEKEVWSKEEIKFITKWYDERKGKPLELDELATKIKRTRYAICIKAKQIGLTETKREMSKEQKLNQSNNIKKYIEENGHPKGMLGKTHTEENKKKQSKRSKEMWLDPNNALNSQEHRQKLSDKMSQQQYINPLMRKGYSRGKMGRREDLGNTYFRSSWEANYARHLNTLQEQNVIYKWEFEVDTFWFDKIKRGTRSYLPDFKVWTSKTEFEYHEVKGYMDAKSKTKLKRMHIYYPHIKIVLIDSPKYKELKKQFGQQEGWEK